MGCNNCANFKVKVPFPKALRTKDLERGMLVESGSGTRFVILEVLDGKWFKALTFGPGYAREQELSLAGNGCQAYENGGWNQYNRLCEVK